jgi:hypothetical protein
MALSAAETTLLYELFGIPEANDGYLVSQLTSLMGAFAETFDWTAVKSALDARLATMAADGTGREARVQAHLASYSSIAQDPMSINRGATGAEGLLVDRPREVEYLRDACATIIGFAVPSGGFVREMFKRFRGSGGGLSR